jgi:hypothetical protein
MLTPLEIGGGRVAENAEKTRLILPPLPRRAYADAQLDDYHGLRRAAFPHRPPLRLSLRACASHPHPNGTLGFGFWNDPFSISGGVLAAPSVVWFFYASPPSDMALVEGAPGWGWKAATLDAGRWPAALLAPAALGAALLTRLPGLGAPLLRLARRFMRAHETALPDVALDQWHTYRLEWRVDEAVFWVDGVERLRAPAPPRGPLGLVLWIDNQYAIASRAGKFGFGLCPVENEQWLALAEVQVEPLA